MPRYFFHIKDEVETIRDEEGIEFHNLDAVQGEAIESAREMMSGEVREGQAQSVARLSSWTNKAKRCSRSHKDAISD